MGMCGRSVKGRRRGVDGHDDRYAGLLRPTAASNDVCSRACSVWTLLSLEGLTRKVWKVDGGRAQWKGVEGHAGEGRRGVEGTWSGTCIQ
jgi:hypothetical protein